MIPDEQVLAENDFYFVKNTPISNIIYVHKKGTFQSRGHTVLERRRDIELYADLELGST